MAQIADCAKWLSQQAGQLPGKMARAALEA
jgi:hypothetical protein